ncbi:MAG TPA: hypothetical protein VHW60_17670 [Caulobacteraceae bacterium]|jgi:hypothetical protein|nr:hypothetical protein [Caulobacteraceae bacterium]
MSFTRSATLSVLRVRVVAGLSIGLGGMLAGVLLLTALFSHIHLFRRAGLVALAISLVGSAVVQGCGAYGLLETKSWTKLGGQLASRREQPAWFAAWVTIHGFLALTSGTGAALLIGTAVH